MLRTLPNLLSFSRIALAPFVVYALHERRYELALGLFLVAGISDVLDGFLARHWRSTSQFGAYLDPVADKILLASVYLTLALGRVIPWPLAALVFGRDAVMLIAIALLYLATSARKFPPTPWGKLSTVLQVCYVVWVVFTGTSFAGRLWAPLGAVLMWLTAGATAGSGLHYGWAGLRMWRTTTSLTEPRP